MSLTLQCSKCAGTETVRDDGKGLLCRECRGEKAPMKKLSGVTSTPRDLNIGRAIDILREYLITTFPDETGEAWAQFIDGGKRRFAAIESTTFRDWIRVSLATMTDAPRGSWVDEIVGLFASEARREPARKLYLRQANINGVWFYQLDEDHTLSIKDGEISVVDSLPMFRQFRHQAPLKVDLNATTDDLRLVKRYVRLVDEWEAELFSTTLCAYGVPGIPRPGQLCRGPPGAAKSTLGRFTKLLYDPALSLFMGTPYPKNEGDWWVLSRQHLFVLLDNLGGLSREQQDEICRFVTGMSIERRKLYTDAETVSAHIRGVALINGIDLSNLASDFLDRSLLWDLDRIPDEERIPEEKFWRDLDQDLPRIRGAIFRLLAEAQKKIAEVKGPEDWRLADFARWSAAVAAARGEDPAQFNKNLSFKASVQKDESLEQSRLTEPLLTFVESHETWEGSPDDLLKELTRQEFGVVVGEGIHERVEVRNIPKEWFKTARGLVGELKRLMHLLPREGVRYTPSRQAAKGRRRMKLEKIEKTTATSATQPAKTLNSWTSAPITGCDTLEDNRNPTAPTASPRVAVADGLRIQNPNRNPSYSDDNEPEVAEVAEENIELED